MNTIMVPKTLPHDPGSRHCPTHNFYVDEIVECTECKKGRVGALGESCEECNGTGAVTQRTPIPWEVIERIYAQLVNAYGH